MDLQEKQREEAISRMKTLRIRKEVVNEFQKNGTVRVCIRPYGRFDSLTEKEILGIREFEHQYNAVVYVVLRSVTFYGVLDAYLFVSGIPDKWEQERDDLSGEYIYCYVANQRDPTGSEFGDITIKHTRSRGLVRTDIDFF